MELHLDGITRFTVTPLDFANTTFAGTSGEAPKRVALLQGRWHTPILFKLGEEEEDKPWTAPMNVEVVNLMPNEDGSYDLSSYVAPRREVHISWDGRTQILDVVAYHYCELDEILDYGDEQRKSPRLRGATEEAAFNARAIAEREIEHICARTFRAAYKEAPARGQKFMVRWPIAVLLSDYFYAVNEGLVRRTANLHGTFPGTVEYITGADEGMPPDVRKACVMLAAQKLMPSLIPDRATGQVTDAGTIRFTLASASSTGLPDVDAVLARYKRSGQVVF